MPRGRVNDKEEYIKFRYKTQVVTLKSIPKGKDLHNNSC